MVDTVLAGYSDHFCVAYLDDILIYSQSYEEHVEHLQKIMERLREHGLYVKLPKFEFFQDEVEFLGYKVLKGGFAMAPDKLEAVNSWPEPSSVKEVQSFLGFANFCREFIPNFSSVATPLSRLTSDRVPFVWCDKARAAFQELKKAFVSSGFGDARLLQALHLRNGRL